MSQLLENIIEEWSR